MPKFSIIIPAHDHYLEKLRYCLESIESCGERDIETILVLSGPALSPFRRGLKKYRNCRIVYFAKNIPPSKARNAGAKRARGEWLVFIDSDCAIPTDYFSVLERTISKKDPAECFVGKVLSAESSVKWDRFEELEHAESLKKYTFLRGRRTFSKVCVGANMAVRKDVFRRVGGFDESLKSAEDREFGARLFLNGYVIEYLDALAVKHKYHSSLFRSIKRHLWHASGNKIVYAMYPQIFKSPFRNRFAFMTCAAAKVIRGEEGISYLVFSFFVGIPYIIKFALVRSKHG